MNIMIKNGDLPTHTLKLKLKGETQSIFELFDFSTGNKQDFFVDNNTSDIKENIFKQIQDAKNKINNRVEILDIRDGGMVKNKDHYEIVLTPVIMFKNMIHKLDSVKCQWFKESNKVTIDNTYTICYNDHQIEWTIPDSIVISHVKRLIAENKTGR